MNADINDYITGLPSSKAKAVVHVTPAGAPKKEAVATASTAPPEPPMKRQARVVEFSGDVPTVPYQAKRKLVVNGETPLLDKNDPDSRKIRERLLAHVRVFDLTKPEDIADAQAVWQMVCDELALVSVEHVTFDEKNGKYLMLLRWAERDYTLP